MTKYLYFLAIVFLTLSFGSSIRLDTLTEEERTIEEREIYDVILAQTTLTDSSYHEIGKGQESSSHDINRGLGYTIIPDSLFKKYILEIVNDFEIANDHFSDSLKLNTTYFSSDHTEKTAKILFSHCGFTKGLKYAFVYFEDWTPYYRDLMAGEGAFVFLTKVELEWKILSIDYYWKAN
ncbi:MAG: hypothetical protein GQ574_07150 [Crocinitomix sp.]|nr:hypothetical protein [Crocinitomix sp.]